MIEGLKPSFREALKKEHAGLTDETIDRSEDLLAQRFLIDPEEEPERIQELDRQRSELLSNTMPRYREVLQRMREEEGEGGR